jgi:hypothetical protein
MSLSTAVLSAWVAVAAGLGSGLSQDEEDLGWPREFRHSGRLIVVYQPQPETFEGDVITGRSAVSATLEGQTEPIFGAFWFEAFVETDRENRLVTVVNVDIPRVRFPDATEEQQREAAEILELEISTWDLVIDLDRLLTSLEAADRERLASEGLATDPPMVIVTSEPSLLVMLDGKAVLHDVEGTELQRVANTPFSIIYDRSANLYYLYAGEDVWFATNDLLGRWEISEDTPEHVVALIPAEVEGEDGEGEAEQSDVDIENLQIVVATEPTELIIVDGPPKYASIEGTDLLYVSNSESDVFLDIATQEFFIVLSGRWYKSASLDGPWSFLPSDSLPGDFTRIPPESARGSVLVYVAGTDQARDAVLDNSIPQTSAVKRDGTLEVTYDGEPKFEPIEGTEMSYAVNTEFQVLEIGGRYYVCHEAVWYESDSAVGRFEVSVQVPDQVQEIPPENPNYNVKYVYVYDSTPDVVYVGYTPGYAWSFIYGPTIVYGTGWWYRPWVSPFFFYPRPMTWGFHVAYNPWFGWSFGFGFGYGPFHFGFWGPSPWHRRGWWGPAGMRHGYHRGFHRGYSSGFRQGFRAGYAAGQRQSNIYNRQRNASRNVDRASARAQMPNRTGAAGGARSQAARGGQVQGGQRAQVSPDRPNNVYADRNGDVHRRNSDGSWQQRDRSGWSSSGQARDPNQQASSSDRSNLNRDHQARQRGAQRSQSYSTSRPSGGAGSRGRRR